MPYCFLAALILSLLAADLRCEEPRSLLPIAPPPIKEHNDIRIVIDTSGSMKQTDPHNLRVPALRLLVHLLPEGQRAGIWLFDASANELVPVGLVDKAWKATALNRVGSIHSKGQFTHIEAALEAAAQDWTSAAAPGEHRDIIVLTDGQVDVSKRYEDSAVSRQRLLSSLLPRLQMNAIRVNTIALSAQSDQDLLKQIALATGGWSETADTASALQRTFIQMFSKTAPPDQVPLENNRFVIDDSIQEFTVLVTLGPKTPATQLLDPSGVTMEQGRLPDNARWIHETGFDLVTVQTPRSGTWTLVADTDPSNQVMVITHLEMDVSPMPNFLTPDERLTVFATFSEDGKTIKREDFLALLNLSAELSGPMGTQKIPMPRDNGNRERFVLSNPEIGAPGDYALRIIANGKTFTRQFDQTFKVVASPLQVVTHQEGEKLVVTLTPDEPALSVHELTINARLTDQAGQSQELTPSSDDHGGWRVELPLLRHDERGILNFEVEAPRSDGKTMTLPIKPLILTGPAQNAESSDAPSAVEPPSVPSPDWSWTIALAAFINLILSIVGYLGYRSSKKRTDRAIASLLGKLSS